MNTIGYSPIVFVLAICDFFIEKVIWKLIGYSVRRCKQ